MSDLSPERDAIVTGSAAHRVMGGWEKENKPYQFVEFDSWENIYSLVKDGVTDIKTLKQSVNDITAAKRDSVIKLIDSEKPFQLTQGMDTYAMDIARSYFVEEKEESYKSEAMKNGDLNELDAVIAAEKHLGYEFDFTGEEQEFFKKKNIGLTPDGIKLDDVFLPEEGLEVKAPTQDIHFFNVATIFTQEDLLRHYPIYYWQCMTGLLVTGAKKWHWFSYNSTVEIDLVYVEVLPVESHMKLLRKRAGLVVGKSLEIVETIKRRRIVDLQEKIAA